MDISDLALEKRTMFNLSGLRRDMSLSLRNLLRLGAVALFSLTLTATSALAEIGSAAYRLAVSEAIGDDHDLAEFYSETAYEPIWTGRDQDDNARREALFDLMGDAEIHGLPAAAYDAQGLQQQYRAAKTQSDLARVEVAFSKTFLELARDIQTGVLVPKEVDKQIAREAPLRSRKSYLTGLMQSTPRAFFRSLAPDNPEYARLATERMRLLDIIAKGGWGDTVPEGGEFIRYGDSGPRVDALRDRLIAMGYLEPSLATEMDLDMLGALKAFQEDHGLSADGVAGPSTLGMINVSAVERLKSVIVAMERERWMNFDRGERYVLVNLADFKSMIFDDGKKTFETRSVVGNADRDRRSIEFSDTMEHMVVNPTWNVPRSIATKEYLPQLQKDRFALDYMNLFDREGNLVDRASVDFTNFDAQSFPFNMKQPPSNTNALGLVKFMFPNRFNIYLHDSPAKSLFGEETRAFSYGCVRLKDPFDFAYALLARQTSDPVGVFQTALKSGKETVIPLEKRIPVHLVYRTAIGSADDRMGYRRDVYGRDGRIWDALEKAGVELGI